MDWEKAFFVAAFVSYLLFLLPILDPASSIVGGDHTFHALKFDLMARHGLGDFPELGGIGVTPLIPPFLVAFFPLLFLGSRVAYYFMYALLPLVIVWLSRKLGIPSRPVFAAIFFPLSLFIFFYFGRVLELLTNIFLLMLFLYMDREPSLSWSALLFFLGVSSHLPTALLYAVPLFLKAAESHRGHLLAWSGVALVWLAWYFPQVVGRAGLVVPRFSTWRMLVSSGLSSSFLVFKILIVIFLLVTPLLLLLKKERKYFGLPMAFGIATAFSWIFGIEFLEHVPGLNQTVPFTVSIMFSFFLWSNRKQLWRLLVAVSFPLCLLSFLFFFSFSTINLHAFDFIDGPCILVSGFRNDTGIVYERNDFRKSHVMNYLAHRGVESPLCTTWEYAAPEWLFYYPRTCDDLEIGLDYVLMYGESFPWAESCPGVTGVEGYLVFSGK